MLRDASQQQVIEKFSFIESLNLSRKTRQTPKPPLDKLNTDQTCPWLQQSDSSAPAVTATPEERKTEASAIVPTANSADISSTISANWYQTDVMASSLSLAEIINATSEHSGNNYTDHNRSKKRNYLGKILFALASSYCLFVVWWIFGHQGNKIITMLSGGKQIVLSESDIEFFDYMERSLSKIDRQQQAQKEADGNEEVVYVPVYTPAPATAQFPQITSNNLPTTTLPSNGASTPTPPKPEPTQALKIPAPPPLPEPAPISNQIATTNKPKIKHTLIGVLELGEDKSAALVNIQGKTRRVWLGEEINNQGWILESVGNQRANISYQEQVRSISVGETF